MNTLGDLIRFHCSAHGLDPLMVAAVVCQESGGNRWATRIEQKSKIWHTLFGRTRAQMSGWCPAAGQLPELWDEVCWRASSFGHMQLLGETARVLGFTGQYLTELCDPNVNIRFGCTYLARCLRRARLTVGGKGIILEYNTALLFYNGGGDKGYPAKVRAHISSGDAQALLDDLTPLFRLAA